MLVLHEGLYNHGYFRRYTADGVVVQLGSEEKTFSASSVYYWTNQSLVPVVRTDHLYNHRKEAENCFMVRQILDLHINIHTAKLLALDDFPRLTGTFDLPNTTRAWLEAGGEAHNVWVPNPDSRVSRAVTRTGGHGYHGYLHDLLLRPECPVFDVIYLDFCGYYSTNKNSIDTLFQMRRVNKSKTFLYLTFCKREGHHVAEHVCEHVQTLCDLHDMVCKVIPTDNSSTMWKCAFLVKARVHDLTTL